MRRTKKHKAARRRRDPRQGRTVVQADGDQRTIIHHATSKGYDVEMIRDFLDHLLLELRVQLYENQQSIRCLKEIPGFAEAMKADGETPPELAEQFVRFVSKYETALIQVDAYDGCDATEDEIRSVMIATLERKSALRDEQIGHLEALQDLFDEALQCAKLPFGVDAKGNEVRPTQLWKVRDMIDEFIETPDFDELLQEFPDHWLLTQEQIENLKAAEAIVATNECFARPLVLFGRAALERIAKSDKEPDPIHGSTVPVKSPEELRFVVAVISKHRGRHDYHGNYYDEF